VLGYGLKWGLLIRLEDLHIFSFFNFIVYFCTIFIINKDYYYYYYYYHYAAFNAPCVGHKDDESQAQKNK